jgi:hypothetical protein
MKRGKSSMTKRVLVLTLVIAGSLRAQSQGQGALTGTVVEDSTGAPIPEVVVTVSAPQLLGQQTVKTDATGTYLIPQLPPGTYAILFEKSGYKPAGEKGIALDADRMLRVNVRLRSRKSTSD